MIAYELFAKVLQSFKTCLLLSNIWCEKLVSSLELWITFDKRFKVILVAYFVPDFN